MRRIPKQLTTNVRILYVTSHWGFIIISSILYAMFIELLPSYLLCITEPYALWFTFVYH